MNVLLVFALITVFTVSTAQAQRFTGQAPDGTYCSADSQEELDRFIVERQGGSCRQTRDHVQICAETKEALNDLYVEYHVKQEIDRLTTYEEKRRLAERTDAAIEAARRAYWASLKDNA